MFMRGPVPCTVEDKVIQDKEGPRVCRYRLYNTAVCSFDQTSLLFLLLFKQILQEQNSNLIQPIISSQLEFRIIMQKKVFLTHKFIALSLKHYHSFIGQINFFIKHARDLAISNLPLFLSKYLLFCRLIIKRLARKAISLFTILRFNIHMNHFFKHIKNMQVVCSVNSQHYPSTQNSFSQFIIYFFAYYYIILSSVIFLKQPNAIIFVSTQPKFIDQGANQANTRAFI